MIFDEFCLTNENNQNKCKNARLKKTEIQAPVGSISEDIEKLDEEYIGKNKTIQSKIDYAHMFTLECNRKEYRNAEQM